MLFTQEIKLSRPTPIFELKQLIQTEKFPMIESLKPGKTRQFLSDVDWTILDDPNKETPEKVQEKAAIYSESLVGFSMATGEQTLFSLITQKPHEVFINETTKPIYAPLLDIQSVRHGQTADGEPCLITMPLRHKYCEFGTVTSISDWARPKGDPERIITRIDTDYLENSALVKDLEQILKENILTVNGEQLYQIEPGNLSYVSLQMRGGKPMPTEIKMEQMQKIQSVLKQLKREDILQTFDFITMHNDLDMPTRKLSSLAKSIGVGSDIHSKHEQGYAWFKEDSLVLLDDKWHAAGKAAERILENGGKVITPSNGDQELKNLLLRYPNGFVSQYPTFLGSMDGLHWLATGRPIPEDKVREIQERLAKS